jgi:hypothetical protein
MSHLQTGKQNVIPQSGLLLSQSVLTRTNSPKNYLNAFWVQHPYWLTDFQLKSTFLSYHHTEDQISNTLPLGDTLKPYPNQSRGDVCNRHLQSGKHSRCGQRPSNWGRGRERSLELMRTLSTKMAKCWAVFFGKMTSLGWDRDWDAKIGFESELMSSVARKECLGGWKVKAKRERDVMVWCVLFKWMVFDRAKQGSSLEVALQSRTLAQLLVWRKWMWESLFANTENKNSKEQSALYWD